MPRKERNPDWMKLAFAFASVSCHKERNIFDDIESDPFGKMEIVVDLARCDSNLQI